MKYTIIGSGPSGLSLAYILALNNKNVELIEKDNQLGGSWNSQWIDDKYFSENSPRVYSNFGNSKRLLSHLGFTKNDFQNIYGNFIETNMKLLSFVLKYFNILDCLIFFIASIKYKFIIENITVQNWMDKSSLSMGAQKAIKIISILICDKPEKTNINDFFGSVSYAFPQQMKEPNRWHILIEKFLNTKDNVKILKNTKVIKLDKTNEKFRIYSKNTVNGTENISESDKVFLCTQSNGLYPILKNSSIEIKNNWMSIDKMKNWSENTFYSGFGFQLHFDKEIKNKSEWCWSCQGDWTVIVLPVSNWLKTFSKDPTIKTVWSCCIVDMDTKSKRINKTANECNRIEVLEECLFQIKQSYKIPHPKIVTTSMGLNKNNNKWISKNTGYTKSTYNDLELSGRTKNLYALGCFTKTRTNHIAYMVGAIDAAAEYINKYENLNINIFK